MGRKSVRHNADGIGKPWLILIIVLAVIAVGAAGYFLGKNTAEDDAKAMYTEQIQSLKQDLDEAKDTVSSGVEEGQDTVESLQAENAELEAKVQEQEAKIADLEKQLEDANSNNTTNTQTPN